MTRKENGLAYMDKLCASKSWTGFNRKVKEMICILLFFLHINMKEVLILQKSIDFRMENRVNLADFLQESSLKL